MADAMATDAIALLAGLTSGARATRPGAVWTDGDDGPIFGDFRH